jgi:hypothetical protein
MSYPYSYRRRSRFTVYLGGVASPRVCLGYTSQGVRDHCERLGYIVTRVERGDYRKKAMAEQAASVGGFVIDHAAVRDACELLGISKPVKIRFNSRLGSTNGNYRFREGYHDIMLKSYRTAEQATETLWHELCHAMQAERAGDEIAWDAVLREQHRTPYSRRLIEVEARQMATDMADIPLAKDRT